MSAAIVLFAHGSRDPLWAGTLASIGARVRTALPGVRVEIAYLEFMQPTLDACVDELWRSGVREIVLLPVFIAAGAHLRAELPALARSAESRRDGLSIRLLPAMGELDEVQQATAAFLSAQLGAR